MNLSLLKQRWGRIRAYTIVLAVLTLLPFLGYRAGILHTAALVDEVEGLKTTVANLNQQNNALTRSVNILGVELEIEKQANLNSQQSIKRFLQEQNELREEVSFYQKVMAPELNEQGFAIESLNLYATAEPDRFRYALVLMQRNKRKNYLKGDVRLTLTGNQGSGAVRLNMLELAPEPQKNRNFRFKYFQLLEGQLTLPQGFTPDQILVNSQVELGDGKKGRLQRSFSWETLVEQGENT